MAHAVKILLTIVARHLGDYWERMEILPHKQNSFQPNRSAIDIMFVIRQLQNFTRKLSHSEERVFHRSRQYVRLRGLNIPVLTHFGMPQKVISIICQFHDRMRVCVLSDDSECSGWFPVKQGRRQGVRTCTHRLKNPLYDCDTGELDVFLGGQRHHGRPGEP